ncbi:MAG: hypothetical protein CL920_23120 [Deltaproteobacteria bacterium]|nr:hypothetical protein [Deltaproteobacteria bacterium]MBU51594.1 hypothetical protein [Deltaproteobacteria bacterium]|tara:strand:- start:25200 stop:26444 length:1245 start_codon:yes stop_codon:yes gene_type:complete
MNRRHTGLSIKSVRWLVCVSLCLLAIKSGCTNTPSGEPVAEHPHEATKEMGKEAVVPDPAQEVTPPEEPKPEPVVEKKPEKIEHIDPYTLTIFDKTRINSYGKVNFQKADSPLSIKGSSFQKVELEVELASTCYPFEKWRSNPPPSGQNWPADCDAYDRNFEISLDPKKEDTDPPAFELMRAITPFGGPMKLKINVTDIFNGIDTSKEHTVRVRITTWPDGKGKVSGSKGGWTVSAKLHFTPGEAPKKVLAAIPLVYHSYKNTSGEVKVDFEVPEGTTRSYLTYTVTGHGGGTADSACIGHADEFCKREHTVMMDGKEVFKITPWRTDCQNYCTLRPHPLAPGRQYCLENPCGAISSVRAPRANWCPGSYTPPFFLKNGVQNLAAGKHSFSYKIANVADKGSWKVSAIFYALGN